MIKSKWFARHVRRAVEEGLEFYLRKMGKENELVLFGKATI